MYTLAPCKGRAARAYLSASTPPMARYAYATHHSPQALSAAGWAHQLLHAYTGLNLHQHWQQRPLLPLSLWRKQQAYRPPVPSTCPQALATVRAMVAAGLLVP